MKLNLGSFTVMFKDWVNIDEHALQGWAAEKGYAFLQIDLRNGLRGIYTDNSIEMIYSSHLLEHLTRPEIQALLNECHRALQPGGLIRLAVPDLEVLTKLYYERSLKKVIDDNEGVKSAPDEAAAFWHILTDNHKTALDRESMTSMLKIAGFGDIKVQNPGISSSPVMQAETKDIFQNHSLYIEGIKSIPLLKYPKFNDVYIDKINIPEIPLNIGLISTQFFGVPPQGYSGLEQVVWDLACGLGELGHKVRLFAPDGSKPPPGGSVVFTGPAQHTTNVDWLGLERGASVFYNAKLYTHVQDLDILHGHNWFGFEYGDLGLPIKAKICHTHHGGLSTAWWTPPPPGKKLNFIAISKFMQSQYAQVGYTSEYAYNGIDLNKYKYQTDKSDRLLFVGRLDTFKQPHVAIEIAKELNMGLDIFGGSFVIDQAYLQQIVAACDGKQIVMHLDASQMEKVRFMQNAKCLLFPSKMNEPFGLVAAEAMACGTPVIALNDGAISEVVGPQDGNQAGVVCKDKEEMKLYVKLLSDHAMCLPPVTCRMQAEKFSRRNMAERYVELYRKMLRGEEW